jgi:hypothetical protein
MNPKHTGFVFTDIRDHKKKDYDVRLLSPQMEILPERYIEWSPKDFFYVMLRDTKPQGGGAIQWAQDPGAQPAPSWLPGAWEARGSHNGVDVKLLGLDAGRVVYRVRAGRQDPAEVAQQGLPEDEARRVLAALGLANGRRPRGLGLVVGGKTLSTYKSGMGYLIVDPQGELRVTHGEPPSKNVVDAVELPLLLIHGNLSNAAEVTGPVRQRGAACVLPSGRTVFALSQSVSDGANAMVLAKLGCQTAVALDRGTHEEVWLQRAGVEGAAINRAEQTTLYAVSTPMRPRAFPWTPLVPRGPRLRAFQGLVAESAAMRKRRSAVTREGAELPGWESRYRGAWPRLTRGSTRTSVPWATSSRTRNVGSRATPPWALATAASSMKSSLSIADARGDEARDAGAKGRLPRGGAGQSPSCAARSSRLSGTPRRAR